MQQMDVLLPGGLPYNGGLERQVSFRPLTGRIEEALIDFAKGLDRCTYVTAVLAAVLDRIGQQPVDASHVAQLCVADRQYLMLRLAALLDGEQLWMKINCGQCEQPFDVDLRRCDLPLKQAGADFPRVTLQLRKCVIELRVPTGADQERIAQLAEEQAIQQLLQYCIRSVNGEATDSEFIRCLSDDEIDLIDEALDEVSPALCQQLLVACPECGQQQYAELDHYALPGINEHFFYDEVHTLASHYHWSEAAILELPLARRRLYLDMINRSAGMAGHG